MPETRTLTDGSERLSYTTKETAQLIREALKRAFPGFRFSVTTSYASMTSSTSIKWIDGPTEPEVEHVTGRFTSRGFDGMTDSTTYHSQEFNGHNVSFSGWVHLRRDVSVVLLEKALAKYQQLRAEYGLLPANVYIKPNGSYSHVDGPDVNAEAGISPCGYRYMFRYVSDAVNTIAHTMRPNGCRVIIKDGRY